MAVNSDSRTTVPFSLWVLPVVLELKDARWYVITPEVRSEGFAVTARPVGMIYVPAELAELANSEGPKSEDTVMEDASDTAPNIGTNNSPKLCGDGSQDQEMTDADQISRHSNTDSLNTVLPHEYIHIDPMDLGD